MFDPEAARSQVRIVEQIGHGVDGGQRQAVGRGIGLEFLLGLRGQQVDDQVGRLLRRLDVEFAGSQRRHPAPQVETANALRHIHVAFLHPAQQRVEGALADDAHLEAHLRQAVLARDDAGQPQLLFRRGMRLAAKLARGWRIGAGVGRKAGGVHQRPHHARLGRDVQVLAKPGTLALVEGDHRVRGRLSAGVERGLGHGAHRRRRAVGIALQADQSAGGLHRVFGGWRVRQRAGKAERRHGNMDQMREPGVEVAAAAGLQQHVGGVEMRLEVRVRHDHLPGVHACAVGIVPWCAVASGVRRRLKLEHFRAEFRQGATSQRAPAIGGVDDADAGKRRLRFARRVGCRPFVGHGRRGLSPMTPSASRASISASLKFSSSLSTSRLSRPRVGATLSMSKGCSPTR